MVLTSRKIKGVRDSVLQRKKKAGWMVVEEYECLHHSAPHAMIKAL